MTTSPRRSFLLAAACLGMVAAGAAPWRANAATPTTGAAAVKVDVASGPNNPIGNVWMACRSRTGAARLSLLAKAGFAVEVKA